MGKIKGKTNSIFVYFIIIIGFFFIMILFQSSIMIQACALDTPVISLSEEEWVKSVSVSISYPESIDEPSYQTIRKRILNLSIFPQRGIRK